MNCKCHTDWFAPNGAHGSKTAKVVRPEPQMYKAREATMFTLAFPSRAFGTSVKSV